MKEEFETNLALIQEGSSEGKPGYQPASGAIFGILKQMKEEFETNLASSQKEEAKAAEDYLALKGTKETQLAATKEDKETMLKDQANNKGLYDAKEDLELTRTQRSE